ncbi:HAMP domain-containing protein [Streptomyces catenulae]|uniref:histidine kinase n=1 Tax=Streptomyces catenulae TaxID=66875 RepID=A0ABV2YZG1_9ACTN|nr:HAMP domain-containing protein [Streptomyces catenulae]
MRSLAPGRLALPVAPDALRVARTGTGESRADVVVSGTGYGTLARPLPGGGAVTVGQSYAGAAHLDRQARWRIARTTAAATGCAALVGWLVLGRVLRPVRRLADTTRRITTTQDLATPLPPAGSDEIGQLTRSFAHMLTALRRSRPAATRPGRRTRTAHPAHLGTGSAELLQRARGRLAPEDEEQIPTTLVTETTALDDLLRELVDLTTDRYTEEEPEAVALAVTAEDGTHRLRLRTGRTVHVIEDATDWPIPVYHGERRRRRGRLHPSPVRPERPEPSDGTAALPEDPVGRPFTPLLTVSD